MGKTNIHQRHPTATGEQAYISCFSYLHNFRALKMSYDLIAFAYAAIVALGGIIGFVKKGSIMSAAMGVIAGSLAGYGAYQTSVNPNNYILSLLVSAGLTALMGYRFVKKVRQLWQIHAGRVGAGALPRY